ncbi:ester cyclase [Herminiimonas sp. NPDC097707]|uniref:ester cyclase n=1 Tax=Herminiimonas sp. NPDC097707 TaxID=3364007 RepID=UPI00383B7167
MNRRKLIINACLVATSGIAALSSKMAASATSSPGVALIDRLVEGINSRELSKLDQIYAAGSAYSNHQVLVGAPSSIPAREEFKSYLAQRIKAFPDITLSYDVAFASDDMVAVNLIWRGTHKGDYLGIAATSKKVTWNSTDLFRIKNGLFSDHWGAVDLYGLERQLRS